MRLKGRIKAIEAARLAQDEAGQWIPSHHVFIGGPLRPNCFLIGGTPEEQAEQEALNVAYWREHPHLCPPSRRRELGL